MLFGAQGEPVKGPSDDAVDGYDRGSTGSNSTSWAYYLLNNRATLMRAIKISNPAENYNFFVLFFS